MYTFDCQPFNLNIMELSDLESEEEEPEERQRRIEQLAAGLAQDSSVVVQTRRAPVNMDIDTLSERSEEEGEAGEEREPRRQRRQSGRRRSRSREQSVAKIRSGIRIYSQLTRHCRYCWRCHHAGHENWQCREEVVQSVPRCVLH